MAFTTPGSGYGPVDMSLPTFGTSTAPCKDNYGGIVTVTASGAWTLTAAPGVPATVSVTIPQGGLDIRTSTLQACWFTVAPKGPVTISGVLANGQISFKNVPLPISNSCASSFGSTITLSGGYTTSPAIGVS
ncbi:hypothetical protein AB0L06_10235 [Spirillospora sp. NPDC052269]